MPSVVPITSITEAVAADDHVFGIVEREADAVAALDLLAVVDDGVVNGPLPEAAAEEEWVAANAAHEAAEA